MNDLSPAEIEALARAMGNIPPPSEFTPQESSNPSAKKEREKKPLPIESLKSGISRAQLVQLKEEPSENLSKEEKDKLYDISLELEVVLGRTKISLRELLTLHSGSIVTLDKLAGEPVEIYANGKKIALAEIVVIEEENFGIKITEFTS